MPATGFIEIAFAAARRVFKSEQIIIRKLDIDRALVVSESGLQRIQTVLTPAGEGAFGIRFFSSTQVAEDNEGAWTLHALRKRWLSMRQIQARSLRARSGPTADSRSILTGSTTSIAATELRYGSSFRAFVRASSGGGLCGGTAHGS